LVTSDAVHNKSNRELRNIETLVLEKGLRFGVRNKKVKKFEILARFEELAQSLNNEDGTKELNEFNADLN
jgi:hypothetical protein